MPAILGYELNPITVPTYDFQASKCSLLFRAGLSYADLHLNVTPQSSSCVELN